ncbi:MAG: protein kinase domain-containing protein [Planctomycetaceae bacterium]
MSSPSNGRGVVERGEGHQAQGADANLPEDPRVIEVLEEYLGQLELGLRPEPAQYVQRYPELAERIAGCLEGLEFVRAGVGVRSARADEKNLSRLLREWLEAHPGPLGDFQIVSELGRGGMGVVYEAVQISLGRRVALKVLPFAANFDARRLQRFKNEAQAAALLHHQNIVAVHAVGCERGVHFYAMQLIEGQSLAVIIRQLREQSGAGSGATASQPDSQNAMALGGGLEQGARAAELRPSDELALSTLNVSAALTTGASLTSTGYFRKIARLMVQAAEALEHAHQLGVVHRDVKPANLLVNASGNLWVTDFGLAQLQADNGLTRSGDLLGTFRYMSPEQTSGQRAVLDHRTDIYSLGATFYELLTLEPVFDGETRQELMYQILHQEPRLPRQVNRAIPAELETIVLKALSKTPADRYATAADLAADVQRYLDDQPIHARRPSLVDRARKWSRRHPSVVVASVLSLTVLAIGLFISNRLISREQLRAESRADEAEAQFRQARDAVNMLIQVGEKELVGDHMIREERLRLLRASLDYYQDFIGRKPGAVTASPSELALVEERVRANLDKLTVLEQEHRLLDHELGMCLLRSPYVQDDLGLSEDARARLAEFCERWAQAWKAAGEAGPGADVAALRRRFTELAEEYDRQMEECLTTVQRGRIRQLCVQIAVLFRMKGAAIVRLLDLPRTEPVYLRPVDAGLMPAGASELIASHCLPAEPGERRHPSIEGAVVILLTVLTRDWYALTGPPLSRLAEVLNVESRPGESDERGR